MITAVLLLAQTAVAETPMFDGKTLTNWTVVGGGKWVVEEEAIKGSCTATDEQGVLLYEKTVKDFEARMQFRIAGGNSGFYFRTERIAEQPLVKGFQAEVDATDAVGGIWETAGRGWVAKPTPEGHAKAKYKAGEWTDLYVRAEGEHYVVRINGETITEIKDPIGRREGHVAIQLHGGMDMTVEFRKMRLRTLP